MPVEFKTSMPPETQCFMITTTCPDLLIKNTIWKCLQSLKMSTNCLISNVENTKQRLISFGITGKTHAHYRVVIMANAIKAA